MEQKIEITLLLIILFLNLVFLFGNSGMITGFTFFDEGEKNAPSDFIKEENIKVFEDKIVLEIENYTLSRYSFTDSMLPVFDSGANGVGIKPKTENEVHVGDIVTFKKNGILIVHRVVEKGIDEEGIYFVTKGDNNNVVDEKIRFDDIDSVLVALFY